jgi:hypothetical protein
MNENDELEGLTPEEKIQADSDLLKIKLEMEFGMQAMGASPNMDDKMQNDFLNYIYNFEKEFAKKKRATVYEIIGKPDFKKADELSDKELDIELERICIILGKKGMELNCICEYENRVIYKFITEELFDHETDDMNVPGMVSHFTYEEFHPNHKYDIEEHTTDFVNSLIAKEWNEYCETVLADKINYNDTEYSKEDFVKIINAFQNHHSRSELIDFQVVDTFFDLEKATGNTEFSIKYQSKTTREIFEGTAKFDLILEYDYWTVSSVVLPGFSQ